MAYYAITITPSPYKKHIYGEMEKSYKTMERDFQESLIRNIIDQASNIELQSMNFELTQKGSVHAHATIRTDKIEEFENYIISKLGYNGRNNKKTDTIFTKEIYNQIGWRTYQQKEEHKENCLSYWFGPRK